MFGMIRPAYAVALIAYAVFCATAYALKLTLPLQLGIFGFQLVTAFVNPYLCLSGTLVSSLYSQAVLTGFLQIAISVITAVSFFLNNYRMFTHFRYFPLYLLIVVEMVALTLVGVNPNYVLLMQMLLLVTLLFMMLNTPDPDMLSTVVMGYICGGATLALYFAFSMFRGSEITVFRRLSFDGNIKSVSTVVAIALMLVVVSLLSGKRLFSNIGGIAIDIILVVAFSTVVILTVAKGILIAIVVGLVVFLIFSPKTFRMLIRVIPILVFATVFIAVMMQSKVFFVQRLFEEDTNMNGRTEIWAYHFNQMGTQGWFRYLIGVGPGNISRIGTLDRYAHSTFLDYFFSFGAIGFLTMLFTQVRVFIRVISCRSASCIALLIFAIFMFLTHGGTNNPTLFTFEVILIMLAERERDERLLAEEEEEENYYAFESEETAAAGA